MKSRFLRIIFMSLWLAAGTGLGAFAQGPGGPSHGGPPPGFPPSGGPPSGGAGPGNQGRSGGPSAQASGTHGTANNTMHSSLQIGPAGRWWDNKTVVQTIGINRDQQKRMDSIFNANKSAIVGSYKAFLREQSKLDEISKDPKVDKERIFAAIDAVSQARSALQKATTEMNLQIRQQMAPDQVEKLEKLK